MSYNIVFKTIIVEKDGIIFHFQRIGCNNDDFGRKDDDFIVDVYKNKKQALKDVERFKNSNEELKLNGKWKTYHEYFNYLTKKIENPIKYDDFLKKYNFSFKILKAIRCKNNGISYSPSGFNNQFYGLLQQYKEVKSEYVYSTICFDDFKKPIAINGITKIYIKKKKY